MTELIEYNDPMVIDAEYDLIEDDDDFIEIDGEKGCFVKGTMITVPGGEVPIETLKVGDAVISFDDQGRLHQDVVSELFFHENLQTARFRFWGGEITGTPNHWVLNQYLAFAAIGSLTVDDAFIDANNHLRPYLCIDNIGRSDVYNFSVKTHHTYIANGIRVHNKGGGKGGGGSPTPAYIQPDTLQSTAIARLVEVLCEGPIRGLVNFNKSIYFDKTPYQNQDGSYNYGGVVFDHRIGTPTQQVMAGNATIQAEFVVGVEVEYGAAIVRTIEDPEIDRCRVTLSTNALYQQNNTSGDVTAYEIPYRISLSSNNGPFRTLTDTKLKGKTSSLYEWSYEFALPAGGAPWSIRVERTAKAPEQSLYHNLLTWARYTRMITERLRYPNTVVVGLTVDAKDFGTNIPSRAYEIYGRIISVPSNYDPISRRYSGLWNGAFKEAWSDNPAWVMYDLLTDGRAGLGRELASAPVDKWGLYAIAQYCDQLVPNGRGGTEPRFTFNGLINARQDAKTVLSNVAGNFRALTYFAMGQIFCSQDKPTDPKRILTNANVIEGKFQYEGTGYSTRHSVALVTWLDPADGYDSAIEVVEDPEMIHEYGYRTLDLVAYGCTSRGQAWRMGMMALFAEKHITRTVNFSTGLDCADLMPGDVISVMDRTHAGIRQGGRLAGATPLSVILDAPYNFDPTQTYDIEIMMPDNTMKRVRVVNPGTSAYMVTLTSALTQIPGPGAVWILYSSKLTPQLFRIMNVQEDQGLTYNFTAVAYDPQKYDEVEKGIVLPDLPTSIIPTGPLPPPYNLSYIDMLYLKAELTVTCSVDFNWMYSDPRAIYYEVEWKTPGSADYSARLVVSSLGIRIDVSDQGMYVFRVRAVDSLGRTSPWATLNANIIGLYRTPPDVTGFLGEATADDMRLTWNGITDLIVTSYEIRFSRLIDGTAKWDTSQILHNAIPKQFIEQRTELQVGTYFIKAVSVKGKYSENAAVITNGVSLDFIRRNIVFFTEQSTAWTGIKDKTRIDAPYLRLDEIDADFLHNVGYYYFDPQYIDLGDIYQVRISYVLNAFGIRHNENVYAYIDAYQPENIYGTVDTGRWKASVEYSYMSSDPVAVNYDVYALANVYDAATTPDVYTDPGGWSPWIPLVLAIESTARVWRFRLRLESVDGDTTPMIINANVTLDMPDRWWLQNDLELPADASGHHITFTPAFFAAPVISAPMVQEGLQGDYYQITNKARTGYTLFLFDAAGNPAARTVDLMAKGYGAIIL